MVNVFKVDPQKKMVGGRKCAIRSFGVISTVWFELDCKHSGWEDALPPGLGLLPALLGPRTRRARGAPAGRQWTRTGTARRWGLWEVAIPKGGFFQQNVPALQRGNINIVIIILCIQLSY